MSNHSRILTVALLLFTVAVSKGASSVGEEASREPAAQSDTAAPTSAEILATQAAIKREGDRVPHDIYRRVVPIYVSKTGELTEQGVALVGEMPSPTPSATTPTDSLKTDLRTAEKFLRDSKSAQPADWKQVIAQWEQDAASSSARKAASAKAKLGQCYIAGAGVNQDIAKGIRFYEEAAESDPVGWRLLTIAKLYRGGSGVPADREKEIYWYRRAADEHNEIYSQYHLARLYGDSYDLEPDYAVALEWALKAQKNNPPDDIAKQLQQYVEDFGNILKFPAPTDFEISVAGNPVKVSRLGTGPTGVIFLSHTGAWGMNKHILANQEWLKNILPDKCSFFIWKYPKAAPFDKITPTLEAYRDGDQSAKLLLPGLAKSVIEQIRQKSGLKQFLIIGNSMGAGLILQDYAKLADDGALSFLLISPTESFMPPTEDIPRLERTTILGVKGWKDDGRQTRTDIWLRGEKAWDWVAANRNDTWADLITASKATDFEAGHLTLGYEIDAELLEKLIRVKMGWTDEKILAEPPKQRGVRP